MSKWICLEGNHSDEVENGFCQRHGPVRTTPLDDEAKKEADVEGALKAKKDDKAEEQAALEAEKRNQESIEAGKK